MQAPQRNKSKKKKSMDIPDEDASLGDKIQRVSACVGPQSVHKTSTRSGCWGDSFSNVSREDGLESGTDSVIKHNKTLSSNQMKNLTDRSYFIMSLADHKRNQSSYVPVSA